MSNPFASLSADDRKLLAYVINVCGDGDHPAADAKTLPHFAADYALECVERAIAPNAPAEIAAGLDRIAKHLAR